MTTPTPTTVNATATVIGKGIGTGMVERTEVEIETGIATVTEIGIETATATGIGTGIETETGIAIVRTDIVTTEEETTAMTDVMTDETTEGVHALETVRTAIDNLQHLPVLLLPLKTAPLLRLRQWKMRNSKQSAPS